MTAFMLDTNIASHVVRGDRPEITARLSATPIEDIVVSAVTEGELLFGLARRNYPPVLTERVRQFLLRVDVLPWDHDVARVYADLRARCEASGNSLSPLDTMITAHAIATQSTLVTRDQAMLRVGVPLNVENWLDTHDG